MSTTVSLRLPDPISRSLARLAAETARSKTFLVRRAIEAYLAEYAEYQVALDRLQDKDDPILSGVELRRRLGR